MATIFNAKARDMIAATVHKVLDAPLPNSQHSENPAQILTGGGDFDTYGIFPVVMGKTKTEIAASFEDWTELSCGEVVVYTGLCHKDFADEAKRKAAEKVLKPKDPITGLQADKTIVAINPGCTPIESNTAVIMGRQLNGTFVIIWAMCPCI